MSHVRIGRSLGQGLRPQEPAVPTVGRCPLVAPGHSPAFAPIRLPGLGRPGLRLASLPTRLPRPPSGNSPQRREVLFGLPPGQGERIRVSLTKFGLETSGLLVTGDPRDLTAEIRDLVGKCLPSCCLDSQTLKLIVRSNVCSLPKFSQPCRQSVALFLFCFQALLGRSRWVRSVACSLAACFASSSRWFN